MARTPKLLNDSRHYYDWLDRAGEDVLSARILMEDDNCYQSAAFHCQQTVEKSLKSYLLLCTGRLVDGHNLSWLCKQAIKHDGDFSQWLSRCAELNKCYIETRYPADIPLDLKYNDIEQYYNMAHTMYVFICKEMDETFAEGNAHQSQIAETN